MPLTVDPFFTFLPTEGLTFAILPSSTESESTLFASSSQTSPSASTASWAASGVMLVISGMTTESEPLESLAVTVVPTSTRSPEGGSTSATMPSASSSEATVLSETAKTRPTDSTAALASASLMPTRLSGTATISAVGCERARAYQTPPTMSSAARITPRTIHIFFRPFSGCSTSSAFRDGTVEVGLWTGAKAGAAGSVAVCSAGAGIVRVSAHTAVSGALTRPPRVARMRSASIDPAEE